MITVLCGYILFQMCQSLYVAGTAISLLPSLFTYIICTVPVMKIVEHDKLIVDLRFLDNLVHQQQQ